MRISDWSSDVCSSDLVGVGGRDRAGARQREAEGFGDGRHGGGSAHGHAVSIGARDAALDADPFLLGDLAGAPLIPVPEGVGAGAEHLAARSEEHTSELQSLMRISYAVFCLKKKKN